MRLLLLVVAEIVAIFTAPSPVVATPASPVAAVYAYDGHHASAQMGLLHG